MKTLIINHYHKKNIEGLIAILNFLKWPYQMGNISQINDFDLNFLPSEPINTSKFPLKKFIFGPHFSIFPDYKLLQINNTFNNAIYIQPSDWVKKLWLNCGAKNIPIIKFPFPVNTIKFNAKENTLKDKVLIYFKHRNPQELNFLQIFLNNKNISYKIFNYDKNYQENDYIQYLQQCKLGIILDAHESQGFAIEEALACNVPLLVWNAKVMCQEYGSKYPNHPCSSIPYWNEQCGEVFYDKEELNEVYERFINKLDTYEPRKYILENLSVEVCAKNLQNLISQI